MLWDWGIFLGLLFLAYRIGQLQVRVDKLEKENKENDPK